MRKYSSLDELIKNDQKANAYLSSLPGYVQDGIRQRANNINSFASLRTYAANLTQGDD